MRTRDVVAMTTQDKPSHRHKSPTVIASSRLLWLPVCTIVDTLLYKVMLYKEKIMEWQMAQLIEIQAILNKCQNGLNILVSVDHVL